MNDPDLERLAEAAKWARIKAANAAFKEKLRARQGVVSMNRPDVEYHPNCIVCGNPNPKGMVRVCSGACYQKAPLPKV